MGPPLSSAEGLCMQKIGRRSVQIFWEAENTRCRDLGVGLRPPRPAASASAASGWGGDYNSIIN
jgi:hypothetical protein